MPLAEDHPGSNNAQPNNASNVAMKTNNNKCNVNVCQWQCVNGECVSMSNVM